MSASFQETVAATLVERVIEAAGRFDARTAVLSGGVAANRRLRSLFATRCEEEGITHYIPPHNLCTDNGAMIAYVGALYLKAGQRSGFDLNAIANMEIGV